MQTIARALSRLTLAACLAWPAASGAVESRGLTVPLRADETKGAAVTEETQLYGTSQALVIGIDAYTNGWPRLSSAVSDARAVAELLRREGFDVTLKTDLTATELEQALKAFFIEKGADRTARLFVWYAGHGHTENGEGFLIPADAPRPEAGPRFKFAALPMRRFGEYVRLAEAKHAFAVFDSCFSGTIFDSARALPPAAITRATTLPSRQFLTSGDAGQTVSDDGTFRELFVRALTGRENADANHDGFVTASELGLFLTDRVTNLTRSKQTPRYGKLRDKNWDLGDFVFKLPTRYDEGSRTVASTESGRTEGRDAAAAEKLRQETVFWESIKDSADASAFESYLGRFPGGTFSSLARSRLATLRSASQTPSRSLDANFAGAWDTSYGRMVLTQDGKHVYGTYEKDNGRIDGYVTGRMLKGSWRESVLFFSGTGDIEFTQSEDGKSFTGRWRHDGGSEWTRWIGDKH